MTDFAPTASFSLKGYKIPEFKCAVPSNKGDIGIRFDVNGEFNSAEKQFTLNVLCTGEVKEVREEVFSCLLVADFTFAQEVTFDTIPVFFYRNSIAIVFPYIRAFISTMSNQSQAFGKGLLLPIMNLSSLEEQLKQNTKVL